MKSRNFILLSTIIFIGVLFAFNFVLAEEAGSLKLLEKTGLITDSPGVLVARIIQYLLGIIGIVLVVLIIVGGFIYMTSGGNEEQVKKSKSILTSAVIGLVIVALAYIIASFVITAIGVK